MTKLEDVINLFTSELASDRCSENFVCADTTRLKLIANQLDTIASALSVTDRYIYTLAPVAVADLTLFPEFIKWASLHATIGGKIEQPSVPSLDIALVKAEESLRMVTLWLFLDIRFPLIYGHRAAMLQLRSALAERISLVLHGDAPLAPMKHVKPMLPCRFGASCNKQKTCKFTHGQPETVTGAGRGGPGGRGGGRGGLGRGGRGGSLPGAPQPYQHPVSNGGGPLRGGMVSHPSGGGARGGFSNQSQYGYPPLHHNGPSVVPIVPLYPLLGHTTSIEDDLLGPA